MKLRSKDLAVLDEFFSYVIGKSRVREKHLFGHLPVQPRFEKLI